MSQAANSEDALIEELRERMSPGSLMYDLDPPDQAAEYLRQALARIGPLGGGPNPLFYALLYTYVAGKSERLNQEFDAAVGADGVLDTDHAINLFKRFFTSGDESLLEDIRAEMVAMTAQVIGSLVDIAGRTALTSEVIATQIERLAAATRPDEVVRVATAILGETRNFVTSARHLEAEFSSSIAQMKRLEQELTTAKREAAIDSLTGLYNRRAFDRKLVELVERTHGIDDSFCLLLLDIDHFKVVNDTYGHMVGDKVLSEFARQIGRLTRRSDFVARYGGEEFALLLPNTRITSAFTVAENVRSTLERVRLRRSRSGEPLQPITVSIGVACYRSDESAEAVIERCDKALYRSKHLGRNRTVIAD